MNIPPLPKYEKDIEQLEKVYKSAFTRIVSQLENVDPMDIIKRDLYESQLRQLTFIINDLTDESREWFEKKLAVAYNDSSARALVSMGMANSLQEATQGVEFSQLNRTRIDTLINDSFQDVLKAHSVMEESFKQLIRTKQAEVLRESFALQRGSVTMASELKSKFLEEGFSRSLLEENWKGITDAGGKRWDLTTYTKMVAKTKLQQTQYEGAKQTALQYNDHDLAVISSHGATDSCRHFEGLIVSLTGNTRGYRTFEEVRTSGLIFHPNCQHNAHPIGDIDALPKALKDKHSRAETSSENAMTNREETLRKDNARRYQEKKERLEMTRQSRRNALAKARERKKIERTSSSMVSKPPRTFNAEETKLAKQYKKDLYKGTPLIERENLSIDPKAVEYMFGNKVTLEGLANTFNPNPNEFEVEFMKNKIRMAGDELGMAELSMAIWDKNNKNVGTITRTIVKRPNGAITVKNDYFELQKSHQGGGFARDIYFKSELLYKEMANGKPININLTANLDVGTYAWAKHGFDFKDAETVMGMRSSLERQLNKDLDSKYKDGEFQGIDYFAEKPRLFKERLNKLGYNSLDELNHSWQFASLDDGSKYKYTTNFKEQEGHFGKKFMLNQFNWDGVKKLNQGHDSEVIGNMYFQQKGVK